MSKKIIVDVREKHEYKKDHVKGARHLPLSSIMINHHIVLEDYQEDDEIIIYCHSGHRAGMAINYLSKKGYKNLINGINQSHTESNHLNA
jgi:phage shock protein E